MALTIPTGYTNTELLALATDAIGRILAGGQAVQFGGKSVTMADLNALVKLKSALEESAGDDSTDDFGGIAIVRYGERV